MFNIDLKKYRIVDISYEVVPPGTDDRPFVIERGLLADNAYKYDVLNTPIFWRRGSSRFPPG